MECSRPLYQALFAASDQACLIWGVTNWACQKTLAKAEVWFLHNPRSCATVIIVVNLLCIASLITSEHSTVAVAMHSKFTTMITVAQLRGLCRNQTAALASVF